MNETAEFKIAYDGEALQSHRMDVRNLAPALLAFGNLFDEANRVLNGNKTTVKLRVKATAPGSFDIIFTLDQSLVAQVTGFLTSDFVNSALNLVGLLGLGKLAQIGLFALIRRLKGKRPTKIVDLKNGFIQLEHEGETLQVPVQLLRLYQDIAVRRATEEILEPLKKEGIDTFVVFDEKSQPLETITKNEIIFFVLPHLPDEIIVDAISESAYSIVSLAFKDDNKWRLFDGSATISVTMSDSEFRYKVDHNLVSFSKGDILICRVRMRQMRTDSGLRTDYEVLEVKEHRPAARQLLLFDTDE